MFAEVIRHLRNLKGLTQRELGDIVGVTQQAVGRWEAGLAFPDTPTLVRLADFFNVTTDYLLGREEKTSTIAAHRTDNPTDDLPKEALDKIEEFKELMRLKYGKK